MKRKEILMFLFSFGLIVTFISCREDSISGSEINDISESDTAKIDIVYDYFIDSRDGHTYKTVKIGDQTWMAENLAYLPEIKKSSEGSSENPYYYVYSYYGDNVEDAKVTDNYKTYGVLYNWPAAVKACPSSDGWELPADDDWEQLAYFISEENGGFEKTGESWYNIGELLRSASGWKNNLENSDKYGFSALPGGNRFSDGYFYNIGDDGYWWSSDEKNSRCAWLRGVGNYNSLFGLYYNSKEYGNSVRCIKRD